MKQAIFYCDDEGYEVELGDSVEFCWVFTGPSNHDGEVIALHPKKREVRIRYRDQDDRARSTGEPRVKSACVPVDCVTLIARAL